MGWYGWDMGGGGWVFPLLVLVLVGVVVYFISREVALHRVTHQPPAPPPSPGPCVAPAPPRPEPLDILRERFARGDITLDEFETAKRALGYPSSQPPPPAPPTG
jgi:uncharacterized membrane protein